VLVPLSVFLPLALALGLGQPVAAGYDEARRPKATATVIEVAPDVEIALALEGDLDSGRRIYRSCAVCHLEDGRGRPDGTFPQLAGQHRSVLIKQLVDIREGRRSNPIMAPYAEALIDAQEIADVAAFIAHLPAPAPAASNEAPNEAGRRLYERDCAACHGARGEGNAVAFVPVLAGQHAPYLLRQVRAIAAGRRDNAHPEMSRRVASYTDADLRAVVAYAATLPGAEAPSR
jgi:cytochrome c553